MAFKMFETETGATAIVHEEVAKQFPFVNPVSEDELAQLRNAESKFKEENRPASCVETMAVLTADGSTFER